MDCKILAGSGCSGGARGDARRIQAASAYHNAHLNQAMRFGRLQVDETLYGQAETTSPPHIKSSWLRPVEGVSFASLVDTEQPSAGTQSAASSVGTPVTCAGYRRARRSSCFAASSCAASVAPSYSGSPSRRHHLAATTLTARCRLARRRSAPHTSARRVRDPLTLSAPPRSAGSQARPRPAASSSVDRSKMSRFGDRPTRPGGPCFIPPRRHWRGCEWARLRCLWRPASCRPLRLTSASLPR